MNKEQGLIFLRSRGRIRGYRACKQRLGCAKEAWLGRAEWGLRPAA